MARAYNYLYALYKNVLSFPIAFYPCKSTLTQISKYSIDKSSSVHDKLNYHEECEKQINNQINLELNASLVYLGMAYYFHRSQIALHGFQQLFLVFSEEEIEHARYFMNYQNLRGGTIQLCDVKGPENTEWTPKKALENAIYLEKQITKCILELHKTASKHNDPHLTNFLESIFIEEQYQAITYLTDLYTIANRVRDQEGLHKLDKELGKKYKPALKQNEKNK